ncbi:MAG: hypothetical protein AB8V79_05340 [Candidatus Midichloria sp.]|uniref:Flagellar FliJ protein n=1 Tax=Hyalomma marginatum TaxID=34627 RepID=A0A8S4C1I7_9ACAR|nr:hypothetical protein MHYMCMPSP_01012 [Hyalomma marginatum]CAG7599456.1 hypothetical protein MHYMCMPASI_01100 [Hyalomma marginatum]
MKKSTIKKILKKIGAELDKKQQELFSKEAELAELSERLQRSINQIAQEKEIVTNYGSTYGFGEFFELEQKKQKLIIIDIKKKELELETIRDQLRDILSEQKKYEYILKKLHIEESKKQEKIERDILDNFKGKEQGLINDCKKNIRN